MKKSQQLLLFCLLLVAGVLLDIAPIQVPDGIDKIYHFIGFSVITISAISTFIAFFGKKSLDYFLLFLLAFGGIAAGICEFLQKFVAIRECSVYDWATNLFGITLVVIITYLVNSKENSNVESDENRFDFKDLPVLS